MLSNQMCGTGKSVVERTPIGEQLRVRLNKTADEIEALSGDVGTVLSGVVHDPGDETTKEAAHPEEIWPTYFDNLRSDLSRIEYGMKSIRSAIERVEL